MPFQAFGMAGSDFANSFDLKRCCLRFSNSRVRLVRYGLLFEIVDRQFVRHCVLRHDRLLEGGLQAFPDNRVRLFRRGLLLDVLDLRFDLCTFCSCWLCEDGLDGFDGLFLQFGKLPCVIDLGWRRVRGRRGLPLR